MNGRRLARRLEELLDARGERGRRIVRLRRRRNPRGSSHRLEDVHVEFADGSSGDFVLKAFGAAATGAGTVVRPGFVTDPYREVWAYERLLRQLDVPTLRAFGTLGAGGGSDRLVIERGAGDTLSTEGDIAAWEAATRWLGSFHRSGRSLLGRAAASGHLLVRDGPSHRRWLRRARRIAREGGRRGEVARLESIAAAFDRAVGVLEGEPPTLLHGEFYASNVLVERGAAGWRVRPVDWESVAVGPAALDLAAVVSGDWAPAVRAGLLSAYAEAASPHPAPGPEALAAGELVMAVQWLGWSSRWRPPAEHARDWLAVATEAAGRVAA